MSEQLDEVREKVSGPHWLLKLVITMFVLVILAFPVYWIGRGMFFTWVDNYQFGYTYNYWNGQQGEVKHNGYVYSPFFLVSVHTIDTRPMQVCISAIQRVLNCKLVHFEPNVVDPETKLKGWQLFIKWHGRDNYEGPGTVGSTAASPNATLFQQIMMNYAYDGNNKRFPFLVIEKEMKADAVLPAQTTQPEGVPK